MGIMRLFVRQKPKIKVKSAKKDGFSGWIKCGGCLETVHANELKKNFNCCPKCQFHYRLTLDQRLALLADAGSLEELFTEIKACDPLGFVDSERYPDRLRKAQEKSGRDEGVWAGTCTVEGQKTLLAVMDFSFMGGSMGSVVGERLTRLIEYGCEKHLPVVIVSASGGARMQESIYSLMQMAKTSAALAKLAEKGVPYISILTNPTMGGVTASFASLGDINIAEPNALIGFAGPRVVEQAMRSKLPDTAQKSEFLMEHGMVDAIVPRSELKAQLAFFLRFLSGGRTLPIRSEQVDLSVAEQEVDIPTKLKKLISAATWGTQKS